MSAWTGRVPFDGTLRRALAEAFGRYQLIRKLATGGMAQIYLARQSGMEGFEKLLVIKRILPHLAGNEEFIKMFLDEARIAARLNHPNVVSIFDLGQIDEHFFIAMEYLHGDDARRVWKQADRAGKPLPVQLSCRIVMDACAGLDYAHKKTNDRGEPLGIVHRDVSPQNIIVTFEGAVKVVDFGIAKAADQSSVTRSGVVKGKYSYMSPEQAAGEKVDGRTDQFALGIVLYELLTGDRLFKRNSDLETLRAVEKCQVVLPSVVNTRVPASLDAVVMRALNKDPKERYRDCLEFQLALEEWLLQNRMPSSGAQLQAFLADIYSEQLAQEQALGHPLWEEQSGPYQSGVSDSLAPRDREPSAQAGDRPSPAKSRGGSGASRAAVPLASSAPAPGGTGARMTSFERALGASSPARPLPAAPPSRAIGSESAGDEGKTISEVSKGTVPSRVQGQSKLRSKPNRYLPIVAGASAVIGAAGLALVALHSSHTGAVTPSVDPPPIGTSKAPDDLPRVVPPPEVQLAETRPPVAPVPEVALHLDPPKDPAHADPPHPDVPREPREPRAPHTEHAILDLDGAASLQVQVDGHTVHLPLHESLAAGRHRLTITNSVLDLHREEDLQLTAGENRRSLHIGSGKVQVVVHPTDSYADVYLHGVKVGTTPMQPLELAEGEHELLFKNPDLGVERKTIVHVNPDQKARVDVNWDEKN